MDAPLDIVVVCNMRDLPMLRLQARSIARYVPYGLIGSIVIIENDPDGDAFAAAFASQVLEDYGEMQRRVHLFRQAEIAPGIGFAHGWRSQQILKMLASRHVAGDTMLILDAKNHFVRPLTAQSYRTADGRLRTYEISQRGHLEHMFRNSFAALRLDPDRFIDHALPNITPFPARTATIRAMIEAIEGERHTGFPTFFLENDVAEFYLLAAFIARRDGHFLDEYEFGERDVVTVFADKAEPGAFAWIDLAMRRESTLSFGVHWAALDVLPPHLRNVIADFWVERGLVSERAEGLVFLASPAS